MPPLLLPSHPPSHYMHPQAEAKDSKKAALAASLGGTEEGDARVVEEVMWKRGLELSVGEPGMKAG